jgi:hypothetical protein
MRVLLSTYGSGGDVETMLALAVQLRALGAEVRMYALPDEEFIELLSTAHFVAQSVAENLAIPNRYLIFAASVLTSLDQNWAALIGPPIDSHRASIGLAPVDDVRAFMFTGQPWLAAGPALGPRQTTADRDVWQSGAWILPDSRPLPAALVAFLDSGTQPVYVALVDELGIGAAHVVGPAPTAASLSPALKTALATETRSQATAVAGWIRDDGATVAAARLLESVSRDWPTCQERHRQDPTIGSEPTR